MNKLRKPNCTQEREAERFRKAYDRLLRAEARMRRAMLAWMRAKDQLLGLERRAARQARIGGQYDPRALIGGTEHGN